MISRRFPMIVGALLLVLAGCVDSTTAPRRMATGAQATADASQPPGSVGAPHLVDAPGAMQGCTPRDPQYGTATIGPSGGELDVGSSRLIIPPGALTKTIDVSATMPAGDTPTVIFQPTGLQFKKPAGLIIDASNCTDVPDVVYIDELGDVSPPIAAVYSTWWHTVAAPIDHFSGYAVA
ncbi:MAG: hypothetical protein ACREPM_13465, partial [Gemmatimonadaceae bacterium]